MDLRNFGLRDASLFDSQGLIAGTWKSAPLDKTFSVTDPSTRNVLGQCAYFGQEDFLEAIDCAHDGYQRFYTSTTAKERASILRRWNDLILENLEDCEIYKKLLHI